MGNNNSFVDNALARMLLPDGKHSVDNRPELYTGELIGWSESTARADVYVSPDFNSPISMPLIGDRPPSNANVLCVFYRGNWYCLGYYQGGVSTIRGHNNGGYLFITNNALYFNEFAIRSDPDGVYKYTHTGSRIDLLSGPFKVGFVYESLYNSKVEVSIGNYTVGDPNPGFAVRGLYANSPHILTGVISHNSVFPLG